MDAMNAAELEVEAVMEALGLTAEDAALARGFFRKGGAALRERLIELPAALADCPDQFSVSEPRHVADEASMWDTLEAMVAGSGREPIGYIDHAVMHDGQDLRVIRALFAPPKAAA